MRRRNFLSTILALALLLASVLSVQAVPPLPTTIYGKVQESGADVPDGTSVTAWMGSTQPIAASTPLSFPGTGVSINFSTGCSGEVTVQQQTGETEVMSQAPHTSVYALNARGPADWIPPSDPETEGLTITLKVSDTVAATTLWSMGSAVPLSLTVDAVAGDLPYVPSHVTLLGQEWDIDVDCTGYAATATFGYDEAWLQGIAESDIAGMARYNASYDRWEYVPGVVDTAANTVTVSDVTAFSRWRLLASVPPRAVADLGATASGGDIVLAWSPVSEDIHGQAVSGITYNVYRGAGTPYFAPVGQPYATTAGSTFTDAGAAGDVNTNYYYVVTAVDALGIESGPSDRVGEFDFALRETTGTDYTWVALPLDNAALAMASHLEQHIESNCSSAVSVLSIARWNATGQQLVQYTTVPIPIGNFALETGHAYRVEVDVDGTDACIWTLTGAVAPRNSLSFELVTTTGTDYTWLSLPVDQDSVALASDLEAAIEAASSADVLSVCRWNAVGQQYVCYTTVPIPIGDFALSLGYPYRIEVSTTTTWP